MIRQVVLSGCLTLASLVTGCATRNLAQYYAPVKENADLAFAPAAGEPEICRFKGDLLKRTYARLDEDYAAVGIASFEDGDFDDVADDIRELGRQHQAALVDCRCTYNHTEQDSGVMAVPTMNTSYATVSTPGGGIGTASVTTTGTQFVPYNYTYRRYDYDVIFYRKMAKPSRFGMSFGSVSEEEARKLGSRRFLKVSHVVPNRAAWRSDIFAGDVLLELDGKPADRDGFAAFAGMTATIKILRDGKELVKTLRLD